MAQRGNGPRPANYRGGPLAGSPWEPAEAPQPGDRAPNCAGPTTPVAAYPLRPLDIGHLRWAKFVSLSPEQVVRHAARAGHDVQVEAVEQFVG